MSKPLVISRLSDTETPVSLFHKLSQQENMAFLFESADGDRRMARFSLIGIDPLLSFQIKNGAVLLENRQTGEKREFPCNEPVQLLKNLQQEYLPAPKTQPDLLAELPFHSGWGGYLGYGMTRYFENIPQPPRDVLDVPDAYLGLYDTVIVFDHLYRRLHIVSHREARAAQQITKRVLDVLEPHEALPGNLPTPMRPLELAEIEQEDLFAQVKTSVTREQFLQAVEQTRQCITEGQVFQLVLAQRFSLPVHCAPLDIYRTVQAINPSPYAYFLQFPEFTYLGSSPETFVSCRNGDVMLHALAGTRPRGASLEADLALEAELKNSVKEMAEHRMLVDLGRNDLGRVCEAGTVEVGEIAQVLRYSHVMHLATRITGKLQAEKSGYEVAKSCFPRGTVSGAPKIRAMQLLAELEPEQRGVYSGMVGYFDLNGNTESAIAIRSALIKNGEAHVHAGAGIVYNSTPEAEYEETRNKAKSILKAIQMANRQHQNSTEKNHHDAQHALA
jgi:anthranilate synthase component 1